MTNENDAERVYKEGKSILDQIKADKKMGLEIEDHDLEWLISIAELYLDLHKGEE